MREYTTPLTVDVRQSGNLTDDVVVNGTEHADSVAIARRNDRAWEDVSARQLLAEVRNVAKGLVAAGIAPGDRVALLSRTRYEWTLLDYAIWFAGAVTVPIFETSSVDQIEWILADSGATALVVERPEHEARVAACRERLGDLKHLWTIDRGVVDELIEQGNRVSDEEIERRRNALTPSSLATLIYTSGTTERPRGCMLTHGNFMFELDVVVEQLHELFDQQDASTLLFLPLAHVFARIIQVGAIKARVTLAHSPEISRLTDDLETLRPTFVLAVPRVFEKLFTRASQTAMADGRGRVFDAAAKTAISYSKAVEHGRPGPLLRARYAVFDRLVYAQLRESLGGRCRHAVSGGAPLGERLGHFFRGIGLVVLEGYGLTETTGAVTANLPDATKLGTVGRPLAGTTIRVAEDGELLVRGGQVMSGYWRSPDASAQAIVDGWLRTGDLGEIDDEGFVQVVGRKKEIIVTAGGKNVAPEPLEERVRAHPLVSQCMVFGDGRPFVGALITLDPESVSLWAEQRGKRGDLAALAADPDLRQEVAEAVADANASVSQAESIRSFRILATDWTEETGELTASLKLRRTVIERNYRAETDIFYNS